MNYCPICGELINPGTVCLCGWNSSRDCERYMSLMPAEDGRLTASAHRRKYLRDQLDAQRLAYEKRIEAIEARQKLFEDRLESLDRQLEELKKNGVPAADKETVVIPAARELKPGDEITFGRYRQGKNIAGEKTELQWIVLAAENGKTLIISKFGLEARPFDNQFHPSTWEKCSLRRWLNSTFYSEAFSAEEQKRIRTSKVLAERNPKYGVNPGKSTEDRVFLLSIPEAEKYFTSNLQRACRPTAYAAAQGGNTSVFAGASKGNNWWWLRSPGLSSSYAAAVFYDGSIYYGGYEMSSEGACVRPAMWISLR